MVLRPPARRGFNGAVASQPRKVSVACIGHVATGGFNGAVASQPRKGRSRGRSQGRTGCFNGAVASQPRKGCCWLPVANSQPQLQWGRGFSATEGIGCLLDRPEYLKASMGPWLLSHGRGKSKSAGGGKVKLQWGRGFSATEGPTPAAQGDDMTALQWGRGFSATEGSASRRSWSSMTGFNGAVASQPRKGSSRSPTPPTVRPLQWGRGFSATEGFIRPRRCHAVVRLQWGRGFSATEGSGGGPGSKPGRAASMGPWLLSHGRIVGFQKAGTGKSLQWGRGFSATEGPPPHRSRPQNTNLSFNGAVASQPRKVASAPGFGAGLWRFNGAVASQPRKADGTLWTWGESPMLQWGRGFSATEGSRSCPAPT